MTHEQALNNLYIVARRASATREEHAAIDESARLIAEFIKAHSIPAAAVPVPES